MRLRHGAAKLSSTADLVPSSKLLIPRVNCGRVLVLRRVFYRLRAARLSSSNEGPAYVPRMGDELDQVVGAVSRTLRALLSR